MNSSRSTDSPGRSKCARRYKYYFRTLRQDKMAMAEYAALGDHSAAECANCEAPCEKACPHGLPPAGSRRRLSPTAPYCLRPPATDGLS